jgi:hypothetical protein
MKDNKALALALLATAGAITPTICRADVIQVNYWGRSLITSTLDSPVQGSMYIDTNLSPGDSDSSPHRGEYVWPDATTAPGGFVFTDVLRDGATTDDSVIIEDGFGHERNVEDVFFARDREFRIDGRPDLYSVTVSAHGLLDFIHGDRLKQRFDVKPTTESLGVIETLVNGVGSYILFAVTRLQVNPIGVCKP